MSLERTWVDARGGVLVHSTDVGNRQKGEERVKRLVSLLASITIVLAASQSATAQDLKKLSLDDSSSIGLKLRTDSAVKVEGAASLRIETLWPTSVCLGEIAGVDVEAARLLFRARVRTDLEGDAFLEMWVQVAGGGQYFSRGMNDAVRGKSDWKSIQTPFTFAKGQKPDKVTLVITIDGNRVISRN